MSDRFVLRIDDSGEIHITNNANASVNIGRLDVSDGGDLYINLQIPNAATPPPLRYWQNSETGRVCEKVLQPGGDWYEITPGQYLAHAYRP